MFDLVTIQPAMHCCKDTLGCNSACIYSMRFQAPKKQTNACKSKQDIICQLVCVSTCTPDYCVSGCAFVVLNSSMLAHRFVSHVWLGACKERKDLQELEER